MTANKSHFAQLEQIQRYFDADFLEPIRVRARASMHADVENVLVWREIHEEIPRGAKTTAEAEFAQAAGCSPKTLRRKLAAINGFKPEIIADYVNAGISWEHMQTAHELAEDAHKTPKRLLDEAINPGNAHGEVMTVDELTAHALGEFEQRPETFAAFGWLSRLAELPRRLGWDADKANRYGAWIEAGKEFLK